MIIGPLSKDVNIDYDGTIVEGIGGAVTFCTPAALSAGARTFAAVKMSPEDSVLLKTFPGSSKQLLPSGKTTVMRNQYFTATREKRTCGCAAQSDPIKAEELPDVDCAIYHLAGLLYGDFPLELIPLLAQQGKLAVDMQGFLRHNEGGRLILRDWDEKETYLPYFDFLKADAAEAETLTGLTDRRAAAKELRRLGAKEILISYNEEVLAYDGTSFYAYPLKARNLSGRTGRGDTITGAYLAKRALGATISEALLYAAACVSLKMEIPGPFSGTGVDVEEFIRQFYA